MNLEELRKHKPQIEAIAAKHGITNIRVFGSVVRGDARPDSDVDLLVTYPPPEAHLTLFDLVDMQDEMQKILNRSVDIVCDAALHRHIGPAVLREARPL